MGRALFLFAATLIAVSCSEPPTLPSHTTPTPTPEVTAAITVGAVTPGSGATLVFRDCDVSFLCTDEIETSFDVLAAADVAEAIVVVSLQRGLTPCAAAYLPATLTKGTLTPFKTASLTVVYDEEGHALCPMPTDSTRLVFEVYYKNVPAVPFLIRELPYRYSLAVQ